jgi:hypothetical protein
MQTPIHFDQRVLRPMLLPLENAATTVRIGPLDMLKSYAPAEVSDDVPLEKMSLWSIGTASTFRAFDMSLRRIEDLYIVTNRRAVREFLLYNQDLAGVLLDALEPLAEAFGPFPQVCLSTVRDPEIEKSPELLGLILTPLGADEALDRLAKFDERWFLRQLQRINGRLIFDLEFV